MKNFKGPSSQYNQDLFNFPKLFPVQTESDDVMTPESNQEVKDQILLFRISALLQAKDYSALENLEFYKYRRFIYPYICLMTMLENQESMEFSLFINQIGKLIDLHGSMDEDFYDQHLDRLIRLADSDEIKLIDLFVSICNGESILKMERFSKEQLRKIEDFLYFIAKFSFCKKQN